jgi:hypothetical protein
MARLLLLEEVDEGAARLVALRPSTGERWVLFRSEHPFPLRPSVHASGTRVALDAVSRNVLRGEYRARVGVLNLETGSMSWLRQSLDPRWRIGGAVFDDRGERLCVEGAYGGAPLTELYVYDVKLDGAGLHETVVAGAAQHAGLGAASPRFLPGGTGLVYLQNARPDGAWEVHALDLERSGDSAASMGGRAPSVADERLTDGAHAIPETGIAVNGRRGRVFYAAHARGRTRQRVRWTPLDGGGIVDLGREHLRIEELAVAPDGETVVYAADGQVWLGDVDSCEVIPLLGGDATCSHRGLLFDDDGRTLWVSTTADDGATLRRIDLETRVAADVVTFGPGVSVVSALSFPDEGAAERALALLPEAGLVQTAERPITDASHDTAVTRSAPAETLLDGPNPLDEAATDPRRTLEPVTVRTLLDDVSLPDHAVTNVVSLRSPPAASPPDPASDFIAFVSHAAESGAASSLLGGLEAEPVRFNERIRAAASNAVKALCAIRASDDSVVSSLVHALGAAGYLRLGECESTLSQVVVGARARLSRAPGLPEIEEYFALAVLKTLRARGGFDFDATFEAYEALLTQAAEAMDAGEEAGARVLRLLSENFCADVQRATERPAGAAVAAALASAPPPAAPASPLDRPSKARGTLLGAPAPTTASNRVTAAALATPQADADDEVGDSWDWAHARALAESRTSASPAPALAPPPTPTPRPLAARSSLDAFAPLGTPAPRPQRPTDAPSQSFTPRVASSPFEAPATLLSIDLPTPLPPAPVSLSTVAVVAGLGGLTQCVAGISLGTLFMLLGALVAVGGVGLLADRRWGFIVSLGALALDVAYLFWFAARGPKTWMPSSGVFAFAVVAAVCAAVLLRQDIRGRFGDTRRVRL